MQFPRFVNTAHQMGSDTFTRHKIRDFRSAEHELRKEYGDTGLYISALRYADEFPTRESEEFGDLYLDFDSPDPQKSRAECLRVAHFFTDDLDLDEQHLLIYFSGSKGYHLVVNANALGVKPMPYLRNVYQSIAIFLRDKLELSTLDLSIYSFGRLFRVVNTKHVSTGRFKIWVPLSTLDKRPHFYIEDLARKPGMVPPKFMRVDSPIPVHSDFFFTHVETHNQKKADLPVPRSFELLPEDKVGELEGYPVCISDILERFIVSGQRYPAQARVLTYLKAIGAEPQEAFDILMSAIRENYPPERVPEIELKLHTSVQSIYREDEYSFSCAFALSLTKFETDPARKVKCSGEGCPLYQTCGNPATKPVRKTRNSLEE
jgi:hypothetical protein